MWLLQKCFEDLNFSLFWIAAHGELVQVNWYIQFEGTFTRGQILIIITYAYSSHILIHLLLLLISLISTASLEFSSPCTQTFSGNCWNDSDSSLFPMLTASLTFSCWLAVNACFSRANWSRTQWLPGMLGPFLNFLRHQPLTQLFRDTVRTYKQQPTALLVIFTSPETEECKMRWAFFSGAPKSFFQSPGAHPELLF